MTQDERQAAPQLTLTSIPGLPPGEKWNAKYDLIESGPNDADFVVETDSLGFGHLRFGDGQLGFQPPPGMSFSAVYRVGNGSQGNVGAEAISRMVLSNLSLSGLQITVRNPLPAVGGVDPEPIIEAQQLAPAAFRKTLERAIVAQDYATLAEENPKLQNASAELVWTGSWYEADVAVDPLGEESPPEALLEQIERFLEPYRRIGHDLDVLPAVYVPIKLELQVCILPDYQRGHVVAALLGVFSDRRLPDGKLGFFHPDNLTFGQSITVSSIVAAAMLVTGVECVTVTELHRLFETPNHELRDGVLPIANNEIAQLDNDPNFPEHGVLKITALGGR
jgi:predicted phage baseplate assembly protein